MVKSLPIRWSRKALETLHDGLGYIARFNPEAAHNLRDSILSALEHIQEFPKAGRVVPEAGDPRVREVLREQFRVIYEIHPKELRILAVRRMERAPLEPKELE
ncbi:MAG: type II toxin-antitoxin system RelE/ParE family toxin [Holophaga sp.]|nr:type II toxin-antitoxin system RelE/ParE family toxin [Holophaga sp.]